MGTLKVLVQPFACCKFNTETLKPSSTSCSKCGWQVFMRQALMTFSLIPKDLQQ